MLGTYLNKIFAVWANFIEQPFNFFSLQGAKQVDIFIYFLSFPEAPESRDDRASAL
jgi:hypothetical protein